MAQAPLLCAAFAKKGQDSYVQNAGSRIGPPWHTGHDSTRGSRFAHGGNRKLHPRSSQAAEAWRHRPAPGGGSRPTRQLNMRGQCECILRAQRNIYDAKSHNIKILACCWFSTATRAYRQSCWSLPLHTACFGCDKATIEMLPPCRER
jgi:hypothetical protein